jgi:hypothetical protein
MSNIEEDNDIYEDDEDDYDEENIVIKTCNYCQDKVIARPNGILISCKCKYITIDHTPYYTRTIYKLQ